MAARMFLNFFIHDVSRIHDAFNCFPSKTSLLRDAAGKSILQPLYEYPRLWGCNVRKVD